MRACLLFAALFVGSRAFAPTAVGRGLREVGARATSGQELSPARERFNRGKKRVLTRGPKNAKRREYFAQRRAELDAKADRVIDEYNDRIEHEACLGDLEFEPRRREPA